MSSITLFDGNFCSCTRLASVSKHFFPDSNLKLEFYVLASRRYTQLSAEFPAHRKKERIGKGKPVSFISIIFISNVLCIPVRFTFFLRSRIYWFVSGCVSSLSLQNS